MTFTDECNNKSHFMTIQIFSFPNYVKTKVDKNIMYIQFKKLNKKQIYKNQTRGEKSIKNIPSDCNLQLYTTQTKSFSAFFSK